MSSTDKRTCETKPLLRRSRCARYIVSGTPDKISETAGSGIKGLDFRAAKSVNAGQAKGVIYEQASHRHFESVH